MPGQILSVDKDTNTLADVLKAVGAAEIAHAWFQARGYPAAPITLREQSRCYQIELPTPLDETTIAATTHVFPVGPHPSTMLSLGMSTAALAPDQSAAAAAVAPAHSAGNERQTRGAPRAARKPSATHPNPLFRPSLVAQDRYRCLQVLQGDTRYQMLWSQWHTDQIERFQHHLRFFVYLFSQSPNPTAASISHWKSLSRQHYVDGPALVKRLQVVNPAAGKGAHALKAGRLPVGNPSEFWLLEYMKYVGFLSLALPVWQPASHDWKVYVLHPTWLELAALPDLLTECQALIRTTTSAKQDILALLEGTCLSLVQARERVLRPIPAQGQIPRTSADRLPVPATCHFDVAWYKDMGNSHALMQLATLPLPEWLRPQRTREAAERMIRLIKSQERLILSLQSPEGYEGQTELALLQLYRNWLSEPDLDRLYTFAARYGPYALNRRSGKDRMPYFPLAEMEALMAQSSTKPTYSTILEDESFEAIATAIRRATISAQYWSVRDPSFPYEVRYQLGSKLLNAAHNPDDLLGELIIFLQSYNAENARVDAQLVKHPVPDKPYYRRLWLRNDHLKQLARLLEAYPSMLIGKLLVGSGYAWPAASDDTSPPALARSCPVESIPFMRPGTDGRHVWRSIQAHLV